MIGFVKVIVGNVPHHHLPMMILPSKRTGEFIRRAERVRLAIGGSAYPRPQQTLYRSL
jgi:hypothetical protein